MVKLICFLVDFRMFWSPPTGSLSLRIQQPVRGRESLPPGFPSVTEPLSLGPDERQPRSAQRAPSFRAIWSSSFEGHVLRAGTPTGQLKKPLGRSVPLAIFSVLLDLETAAFCKNSFFLLPSGRKFQSQTFTLNDTALERSACFLPSLLPCHHPLKDAINSKSYRPNSSSRQRQFVGSLTILRP